MSKTPYLDKMRPVPAPLGPLNYGTERNDPVFSVMKRTILLAVHRTWGNPYFVFLLPMIGLYKNLYITSISDLSECRVSINHKNGLQAVDTHASILRLMALVRKAKATRHEISRRDWQSIIPLLNINVDSTYPNSQWELRISDHARRPRDISYHVTAEVYSITS